MSGAYFVIRGEGDPALIETNGTLHLEHALKDLAKASPKAFEAALKDIGEMLKNSHRQRWRSGASPAGEKWAPLSEAYLARKMKKTRLGILVLDGYLRDLLRYQIDGCSLEFGTDRVYGATHQFGDAERHIPARPFLGLSTADEEEVQAIIADHLSRALGG